MWCIAHVLPWPRVCVKGTVHVEDLAPVFTRTQTSVQIQTENSKELTTQALHWLHFVWEASVTWSLVEMYVRDLGSL